MTTVSPPAPRPSLARSLIGMKVIMAVTGVILFLFVVGHLVGNLKVYQGAAHFNAYAEGLRTVGAPFFGRGQLLWAIRVALLAALAGHLWAALVVTRASWRARPIGYHQLTPAETTYAARSMRWGGVLILAYVVYHLLDLSFGPANPSFVAGDAYHNLVASLARWPVATAYGVAMLAVGLHIYHGLWSAGQTLGLNRPPTSGWRRGIAALIAGLVTAGYLSIPVAVLSGLVR